MEVTLDAQTRSDTGKGPARRARAAGMVPAVLYGASQAPTPVYVNAKQMSHALHTEAGLNVLINLQIDGSKMLTVPREIQKHPVRGDLIHIDFLAVERNVKIEASVPIHLAGESRGVKEGGQMDQHTHELRVSALPTDIPSAIEIEISDLGIGTQLKVSDVQPPSGVEILNDPDEVLLAVIEPLAMKTELEVEEPEGGAAPSEAPAEPASESASE